MVSTIKKERIDIDLSSLSKLVDFQRKFQVLVGNEFPKGIVTFENIQESLSQNVYQTIEFQEFMEANEEERKEELIDYLLFLINKYIFLGIDLSGRDQSLKGTLWSKHSQASFASCDSLYKLEQNDYISFIRTHCTFKPWKVRDNISCVDDSDLQTEYFMYALTYFKDMANIVFSDYQEFFGFLMRKAITNVDRQMTGY